MNIGFAATESPYESCGTGGIASYLRAIIPALLEAGHRVTLFAGARETQTFLAEGERVEVYHIKLPSMHWYASRVPLARQIIPLPLRQIEWSVAFYRLIASVTRKRKLDVLECTETGALFLNRIAPVVVRLHGSELTFRKYAELPINLSVRLNELLESRSCDRAQAVTSPSTAQASEIIRRRSWSPDRIRVIPNPISADMLKAASEHKPTNDVGLEHWALYAGRLAPVKGIEPLLESAKRIHDSFPNVTFVFAGPWQMPHPPEMYDLELNRRSKHGVLWIGPQQPSQLIEWYRRADVFVMPSYYETFGIGVVEAMAFGFPVIATRSGGLPEVVEDGVTGILVQPGDSEALAAAISHLLNEPELRQRMGKAGRERVLADFTVGQVLPPTLQVYQSLSRN